MAVIGSHDGGSELATRVGGWIARSGHHLLTGGGPGVMECAGRGFCEVPADRRSGRSIGVIPFGKPAGEYPNGYVEIAINTHLAGDRGDHKSPRSRNHINILSADAVVAFHGGGGTLGELELAVETYRRPVIVVLSEGETVGGRSANDLRSGLGVRVVSEVEEATSFLEETLRRFTGRRLGSARR